MKFVKPQIFQKKNWTKKCSIDSLTRCCRGAVRYPQKKSLLNLFFYLFIFCYVTSQKVGTLEKHRGQGSANFACPLSFSRFDREILKRTGEWYRLDAKNMKKDRGQVWRRRGTGDLYPVLFKI